MDGKSNRQAVGRKQRQRERHITLLLRDRYPTIIPCLLDNLREIVFVPAEVHSSVMGVVIIVVVLALFKRLSTVWSIGSTFL